MTGIQKHLFRSLILVFALTPHVFWAQQGALRPERVPPQQPAVYGDEPVVVNTDLVTLGVTVTDALGRHVEGLDSGDFAVYDNRTLQEIAFFSDEDEPVSVAVVFDVSGSMSEDKIARARLALAHFIKTSHPADEFYLICFNSEARLLLERTRDADAVANKLTYVQSRGNTALYDAAYLGLEKVVRGAHPRRALLIISDGEDNRSRLSLGEVRRRLQESDVAVYSIGIGVGSPRFSSGKETLKKLSAISGGQAFFPGSAADMDKAVERIALELRHQYSIGYKPSSQSGGGEWHSLKVKVTPPSGVPRLFVRSREGYFFLTNPHPPAESLSLPR